MQNVAWIDFCFVCRRLLSFRWVVLQLGVAKLR